MQCPSCSRRFLPGSVRCIYCGAVLPPEPDFDLGSPAPEPAPATAPDAGGGARRTASVGVIAGLLLLLFKGKSLLTLLKVGPLLTTLGSMGVWIAFYAQLQGLQLATGFAFCILIHELGHVWVSKRYGLKATAPIFIPMFGALIWLRSFRDDPKIESDVGAGGPAGGVLAMFLCWLIYLGNRDPFWLLLAALGAGINMFNLIPMWQLDGAHITKAMAPRNWDFVLAVLLLLLVHLPSPLLWLFLIALFFLRLGQDGAGAHSVLPPLVRARVTLGFLALLLVLGYGMDLSWSWHQATRSEAAPAATAPAVEAAAAEVVMLQIGAFLLMLAGTLGWVASATLGAFLQRQGRRAAPAAIGAAAVLLLVALEVLRFNGHPIGTWATSTLSPALALGGLAAALTLLRAWLQRAHLEGSGDTAWRTALAATAGAAAAVVYWSLDPALALILAATASAYFYWHRSQFWSLLASVAAAIGFTGRVPQFKERAFRASRDAIERSRLALDLAREALVRERGAETELWLDCVGEGAAGRSLSPAEAYYRARAELLLDRSERALALVEELLAGRQGKGAGVMRLLLARALLSRIALSREWSDEALAQASSLLRELPRQGSAAAAELRSSAHLLKAASLVRSGRHEEAALELAEARRWRASPEVEAGCAVLRAESALARGDAETALREARSALARLPGHLAAEYWHARALESLGRSEEARGIFTRLSLGFPGDHWGRAATAA